jgi:hypothetical protein
MNQTRPHRIVFDVFPMLLITLLVDDAHVGKSTLPNLTAKSKFLVGAIRKAALDQLHRHLNAHLP